MKRSSSCVLVVLALTTACNDSSEGGSVFRDVTAPAVVLTFPPAVSATDAEAITATGTASDASGVAEVRVNGVLATTNDGFATWQVEVPLALGTNTLTVAASDSHGNTDTRAAEARIESQALLLWPTAIAVDPSSPRAFVLDAGHSVDSMAIKSVDLMSGVRAIVSDRFRGTGPPLSHVARAIAIDGGRALVATSENAAPSVVASVIAVDLVSGDRTILSDDSHGLGPSFAFLLAITVDADRALVTSSRPQSGGAVVAVDLVSGDRTILSDPTVGAGPMLGHPEGIVVDGSRALVLDGTLDAVVAVDLASGDRTIVSDASTGTGPLFDFFHQLGITLDGGRALIVDSGLDAVIAVDLASGDRTFLAHPAGRDVRLAAPPLSIALDVTDGTRALVAHAGNEAVVGVDLTSGERAFVSPPTSVGTGPSMGSSRVLALEGDLALVRGESDLSLVAVDLASGARRTVSAPLTGNGLWFQHPDAVALDGERALVLAENADFFDEDGDDHLALFAVDLASGNRSILSDELTGEGGGFGEPRDIALAGNLAFVTDLDYVIAVDLVTGDRTIVSGRSRGAGPHFHEEVRGIVLDGDRAIVADDTRLVAVDLASGDRTVVSSATMGQGPVPQKASDLLLDGERVLALSDGRIFAVDLATGDRTILVGRPSTALEPYDPVAIARSGDRLYATSSGAILALDPPTGQRVIVSR